MEDTNTFYVFFNPTHKELEEFKKTHPGIMVIQAPEDIEDPKIALEKILEEVNSVATAPSFLIIGKSHRKWINLRNHIFKRFKIFLDKKTIYKNRGNHRKIGITTPCGESNFALFL